jgi:hypothetical protein
MYERRRGLSKQTRYALCWYKDLTEVINAILNCINIKLCYKSTYNTLLVDETFFSNLYNISGKRILVWRTQHFQMFSCEFSLYMTTHYSIKVSYP